MKKRPMSSSGLAAGLLLAAASACAAAPAPLPDDIFNTAVAVNGILLVTLNRDEAISIV